ncbi:MAG: nucleotide exchange factor GrpE [Rhodothermales bacterium]
MEGKKRQEASELYKKQSKSSEGDRAERERDDVRERISGQMEDNEDAADIALAAVDELAGQAGEIDDLNQKLQDAQDQLLRKVAEFKNYRRRTEEEKKVLVEIGRSQVIQQFLDVLDDFDRSLDAAEQVEEKESEQPGPAYEALKQGVVLVYKKFKDELAKLGVEPIEAVGQPFDENLHEAMMQREIEGTDPGVVVDEIQKGYRMGDRVLRHSKVIVSS